MFISPRRISLLIHMLTLTPLMWNEMVWLLRHHSRMVLAEWWALCHPFRCDGDKRASIKRFLSPVMWFVHPLSRTHSVVLGWSSCRWISVAYNLICFISEEYDIKFIRWISSSSKTDISIWGCVKWKFISSWLACILSGNFVRSPANSSDVKARLETWPCIRD